jgi:hypothetical protein
MNRAARLSILAAYAAAAAWALAPAPPKPLVATIAPPPPIEAPKLKPEPEIDPDAPPPNMGAPTPRPRADRASTLVPGIGERYDLPSGVKVSFEPEDMWAYVNLKFPEIPPVEYDHPFDGKATIYYATDEIWNPCGKTRKDYPDGDLAGCAWPHDGQCTIIIAPLKILRKYGLTPRIVLRHELGHCNGWGQDHAGAR